MSVSVSVSVYVDVYVLWLCWCNWFPPLPCMMFNNNNKNHSIEIYLRCTFDTNFQRNAEENRTTMAGRQADRKKDKWDVWNVDLCVYDVYCVHVCVHCGVCCACFVYTQMWNSRSWWSRQTVQRNNIKVHSTHTSYVQSKRTKRKKRIANAIAHARQYIDRSKKNEKSRELKTRSLTIYLSSLNCVCVAAIFECNRRSCVAVGNVQYEHLWYFHVLGRLLVHYTRNAAACLRLCACVFVMHLCSVGN